MCLQTHDISTIDVVVVNLYPFRATVTAAQAPSFDTAIENIDIGERHRLPRLIACVMDIRTGVRLLLPPNMQHCAAISLLYMLQ